MAKKPAKIKTKAARKKIDWYLFLVVFWLLVLSFALGYLLARVQEVRRPKPIYAIPDINREVPRVRITEGCDDISGWKKGEVQLLCGQDMITTNGEGYFEWKK